MTSDDSVEQLERNWYEHKSRLMQESLGTEHDRVMHALIPYAIGGALDLYYFPSGIPGTAIATKELSVLPNEGSANSVFASYELVMFTRHALDLEAVGDEHSAFGRAHQNIAAILNPIARYSEQATLNPGDTCEFPEDMDRVGGKCVIFDGYGCHSDDEGDDFGLLAVMEIFRSEMNFARQEGGDRLIELLKDHGVWPYSDTDREPVV